jgi:hypothetical protein
MRKTNQNHIAGNPILIADINFMVINFYKICLS